MGVRSRHQPPLSTVGMSTGTACFSPPSCISAEHAQSSSSGPILEPGARPSEPELVSPMMLLEAGVTRLSFPCPLLLYVSLFTCLACLSVAYTISRTRVIHITLSPRRRHRIRHHHPRVPKWQCQPHAPRRSRSEHLLLSRCASLCLPPRRRGTRMVYFRMARRGVRVDPCL
jgi:hypothetical protein